MDWILITTTTIAGLLIGSFLNVVVYRGPAMWGLVDDSARGTLAFPRSYCPACKRQLSIGELIPLLSYILSSGRCRSCSAPIKLRYPIIELLGALAVLLAIYFFGFTVTAFSAAMLCWFLIALAAIDLETGFLPDMLTLPLIFLGLAANGVDLFVPLKSALIGAAAGYGSFRLIGELFLRLRGKEGLGQGDAKLLAALGAWLGWQALPIIVLAGSVSTLLVIVLSNAVESESKDQEIPFGPGLCFGGAIALIISAHLTGL